MLVNVIYHKDIPLIRSLAICQSNIDEKFGWSYMKSGMTWSNQVIGLHKIYYVRELKNQYQSQVLQSSKPLLWKINAP